MIDKLLIVLIIILLVWYCVRKCRKIFKNASWKAMAGEVLQRTEVAIGDEILKRSLLQPIGGLRKSILQQSPLVGSKPKTCTDSKLEVACIQELEYLFDRPFNKVRPDFLRNPITGQNLEADAYNEELGLVVEVQGRQHYEFVPFFHKNKQTFRTQQYRDHIKRQCCSNNGIVMLEVPYTVKIKNLRTFLRKELRNLGYNTN